MDLKYYRIFEYLENLSQQPVFSKIKKPHFKENMSDLEVPVFHRDIKPSNVIIDPSKGAVVIDFGLAKGVAAGSDVSLSRGISEGWSPPERRDGISGSFTDVFSLGQILWHMLTNESAGIFSEDRKSERIIECGHPRLNI